MKHEKKAVKKGRYITRTQTSICNEVKASLDLKEVTELKGFKVYLAKLLRNWKIVTVKYLQLGRIKYVEYTH